MGNANAASTTYSVRVPWWMDDEIHKRKGPDETPSDVVRRAIVLLITTTDPKDKDE